MSKSLHSLLVIGFCDVLQQFPNWWPTKRSGSRTFPLKRSGPAPMTVPVPQQLQCFCYLEACFLCRGQCWSSEVLEAHRPLQRPPGLLQIALISHQQLLLVFIGKPQGKNKPYGSEGAVITTASFSALLPSPPPQKKPPGSQVPCKNLVQAAACIALDTGCCTRFSACRQGVLSLPGSQSPPPAVGQQQLSAQGSSPMLCRDPKSEILGAKRKEKHGAANDTVCHQRTFSP